MQKKNKTQAGSSAGSPGHLYFRLRDALKNYLGRGKDRLAPSVYQQSLKSSIFLAAILSLSFAYSLSLEMRPPFHTNTVLVFVQLILALILMALPYATGNPVKAARLYGLIMLALAIIEMETQFRDESLFFYDSRSWLANLALMASFSFFHVGSPVQFASMWFLALCYYALRALFETDFNLPRPLIEMLSSIIPLSAIWIVVNGWWFRIRLQYFHAREELQTANALLTEIDRFRSNFFASISHEFRTPLTLILSPLKGFMDRSENDAELNDYLLSVRTNGNRLLLLVNNLIDLARLDAGRMYLHLDPIDLCELVRGTIAAFDQSYRTKGLALRAELPLQLLTLIDVEKTETILINLLGNALKFTDAGGVTVRLQQEGHRFLLQVTDSGKGIGETDQRSLFERFGAIRTMRSGSGLGLALSRELARFMDGDLRLKSSHADGSVFELTLPLRPILFQDKQLTPEPREFLRPPDQEELPARTADVVPENAELILIIEDNNELRRYLRRIIEKRFHVLEAADGEEALQLSAERIPDAVVSDIVMPSVDGFQVMDSFRTRKQYSHIPFLFLTARAGLEDRLEGLRHGVDDYLVKPFDPVELIEKVAGLIRRKKREEDGLRAERQSLVGDLHDMVGSDLTDLLLLLGAMQEDQPPGERLGRARQLGRNVLNGLRDRIHEREDLELIQKNFMHGMKVILHRRYAGAGRSVRFRFDHQQEEIFVEDLQPSKQRCLYTVFLEICTNDLKYGSGISSWNLSYVDHELQAEFVSESAQSHPGRLSFQQRLLAEGGDCEEKNEHGKYCFRLSLRLNHSNNVNRD